MKHSLLGLCVLIAFSFLTLGVAKADGLYVIGGANMANLSELNTDNLGYSGEAGWTNGTFAIGMEVSNHVRHGNETLAGAVNARVFMGDWSLRPYLVGGVGATFEGNPLAQASGGLMWVANDEGESGSFNIYGGYKHRWYFESFSNFNSVGDDGHVEFGVMFTF